MGKIAFRSNREIEIAKVLDEDVLFYPNSKARLNTGQEIGD